MFSIEKYLTDLIEILKTKWQERLVYVGLQGSYLRQEADENSDIDIMVVIDSVHISDLQLYRNTLESLEFFEKSCGFLCGKDELKHWNPLEICHLLHTTKDYYGNLKSLVPSYDQEDEKNYIKLSLNNLYHALCHSYIHRTQEFKEEILKELYKSTFFILQNLYYQDTKVFYPTKRELLSHVKGKDKRIMEKAQEIQEAKKMEDSYAFDLLFSWCQERMISI